MRVFALLQCIFETERCFQCVCWEMEGWTEGDGAVGMTEGGEAGGEVEQERGSCVRDSIKSTWGDETRLRLALPTAVDAVDKLTGIPRST